MSELWGDNFSSSPLSTAAGHHVLILIAHGCHPDSQTPKSTTRVYCMPNALNRGHSMTTNHYYTQFTWRRDPMRYANPPLSNLNRLVHASAFEEYVQTALRRFSSAFCPLTPLFSELGT